MSILGCGYAQNMNKWRQTHHDHIFHLYWAFRLVQLTSAHATSNIVWYICESVCLQYRHTEEWSWNLGPFHVNIWSELVTCKAYNWLRSIYSCCQCYLPSYTCTACLSDDWVQFWAAFQTSIGSLEANYKFPRCQWTENWILHFQLHILVSRSKFTPQITM